MARRFPPRYRTLRFHKLVRAPLPFVYRWCTDYRDDDDRLTNDLYHYEARVVLREPERVVRIIVVPGRDRNRHTDVEIISLLPPDRWRMTKLSVTDDESASYRLHPEGPELTRLDMRFRETWKSTAVPDRRRYRALFHEVWDRYVQTMEAEYRRRPARASQETATPRSGSRTPDAPRRRENSAPSGPAGGRRARQPFGPAGGGR